MYEKPNESVTHKYAKNVIVLFKTCTMQLVILESTGIVYYKVFQWVYEFLYGSQQEGTNFFSNYNFLCTAETEESWRWSLLFLGPSLHTYASLAHCCTKPYYSVLYGIGRPKKRVSTIWYSREETIHERNKLCLWN